MVTFNEKSYTIEVYTGHNPVEDWLLMQKALGAALGCETDLIDNEERYHLSLLLRNMLPDWETARKMFVTP